MKPPLTNWQTIMVALSLMLSAHAPAFATCSGRFMNPITDICWRCIFPITLGNVAVHSSELPDTPNPKSPICSCGHPIPRFGLSFGYWEPIRLVDVTRHPYCLVNLGGLQLNIGNGKGSGSLEADSSGRQHSFYQVHWYMYPVLYWLNLITDVLCVEQQGFDVAYLSELDPTWNDDELSFILNPEAILFANPAAQALCAADCTQATHGLPNNKLFWCGGCQGSIYPLSGQVQAHLGGVQATTLLTQRLVYKLHREGLLWDTTGNKALCQIYPMPLMKKANYRLQMTYPIPTTTQCFPFGRSTTPWESGKEYPVKGEDFGYLIWRKRNCCAM